MNELQILLLEDDIDDAELIADTIQQGGLKCTITTARSEIPFRKALEQGTPDIILADYALPRFDGIAAMTLAQQMRPGVPVVIISGVIGEELAVEMLRVGASDYILKNRLDRLVPVIVRCVREHQRNRRMIDDIRGCADELRKISSQLAGGARSVDVAPRLEQIAQRLDGTITLT